MADLNEIAGKLRGLLAEMRTFDDPRRASAQWKSAFNELKKTKLNANHVANVIARRDVNVFAALIDELAAPPSPPEAATDSGPQIDDATLKSAMKAFRRRLKLTKLDDESQLTVRPLTGGKASEISSIIPPDQFPPEVWIELARQGKLRATGKGFYELTES